MNTDIRNATNRELRALAVLNSAIGQVARAILAERDAASERLSAICRAVRAEQ
tara:strand:+ start:745 stop:903 length:159 start_codon:yes stop_codon:yes gene_type:complete